MPSSCDTESECGWGRTNTSTSSANRTYPQPNMTISAEYEEAEVPGLPKYNTFSLPSNVWVDTTEPSTISPAIVF